MSRTGERGEADTGNVGTAGKKNAAHSLEPDRTGRGGTPGLGILTRNRAARGKNSFF